MKRSLWYGGVRMIFQGKPGGVEGFVPDCLIFDVDGVLIDSSASYPEMIRIAVEREWEAAGFIADAPGYSAPLDAVFKRHGGFNDDAHIAWGLLNIMASRDHGSGRLSECAPAPAELETIIFRCDTGSARRWLEKNYAERFPLGRVAEKCMEIYHGSGGRPGVYTTEKPMLNAWWGDLPLPAYVFTGRSSSEWELAKVMLSWGDFPDERAVTSDSGMLKPSPEGLEHICRRFGHETPLFFGDTASDRMSFEAFGKGGFVAIGNNLGNWTPNFPCVRDALSNLIGWRG
jgi:phosphoglycolate phosphatase-like HAD superfamily hydrolase